MFVLNYIIVAIIFYIEIKSVSMLRKLLCLADIVGKVQFSCNEDIQLEPTI